MENEAVAINAGTEDIRAAFMLDCSEVMADMAVSDGWRCDGGSVIWVVLLLRTVFLVHGTG